MNGRRPSEIDAPTSRFLAWHETTAHSLVGREVRDGDGHLRTTLDPAPATGEHADKSRVLNLFELLMVRSLGGLVSRVGSIVLAHHVRDVPESEVDIAHREPDRATEAPVSEVRGLGLAEESETPLDMALQEDVVARTPAQEVVVVVLVGGSRAGRARYGRARGTRGSPPGAGARTLSR